MRRRARHALLATGAGGGSASWQWKIDLPGQRPEGAPDARDLREPGQAAAVVHLAGLAAGAVDPVALAPAAHSRATWRCRCGSPWCRWLPTWTTDFSDRSLLLGLPALATLAAFALPTLRRSVAALIDWFTLLFFSGCGLHHLGLLDGDADRGAAQDGRQHHAPGARLRAGVLLADASGSRWRRRWRGAGWCGGAPAATARRSGRRWCCPPAVRRCAGCCGTTLWLPALDHALQLRSAGAAPFRADRPDRPACPSPAPSRPHIAALRFHGNFNLKPLAARAAGDDLPLAAGEPGRRSARPAYHRDLERWRLIGTFRRPTSASDDLLLYQRITPAGGGSASQAPRIEA